MQLTDPDYQDAYSRQFHTLYRVHPGVSSGRKYTSRIVFLLTLHELLQDHSMSADDLHCLLQSHPLDMQATVFQENQQFFAFYRYLFDNRTYPFVSRVLHYICQSVP